MILPRLGIFVLTLVALACLPGRTARASEPANGCTGTIDALHATIRTPGTWCLARDLSTARKSGFAISIAVDDVTLDCNGHRISPRVTNPNPSLIGIYAQDRSNVVVRNCKIDGFLMGISLYGGDRLEVRGNRLSRNMQTGIFVAGADSVVRDNTILDTGGLDIHATGIAVTGDVDILGNLVNGIQPLPSTHGPPTSAGITSDGGDSVIAGNRIRGLVKVDAMSLVLGISATGNRTNIHDNDVIGTADSRFGISCFGTHALAVHNVVNGFATPIYACIESGNATNP